MAAARGWLARAFRGLDAERLAVFFLLVVPAVGAARFRIQDFDIWWHLAQGKWIVEQRAVPWEDPFSYTGRIWIAYSWLPEIAFYAVDRIGGLRALRWLQALGACAVVGFVYLACRAEGARRSVAVAVGLLVAFATAFEWGIRPLLFSLVLLAVLSWALRAERLAGKLAGFVPPLLALWANVHVLFAVGLALVAFAALCRTLEGRPSRSLWTATFGAALVTLANPYGWRLLENAVVLLGQPAIVPEVVEFHSPGFGGVFGLMLAAFLFPALATIALSREPLGLFELGTFVGSLAMGLAMSRNMTLFAILAAPIVARRLEGLLPPPAPPRPPSPRLLALHWALLAGGLACAAASLPRSPAWLEQVESERLPIAAVDFLAERHPRARLFNDFNWGGYLIYRLFPGTKVSMDGRTTVYAAQTMRAYMRTHYALSGWERFLAECDPEVVLWPADGPLASVLRTRPEWRVEFEDETAVVFARNR